MRIDAWTAAHARGDQSRHRQIAQWAVEPEDVSGWLGLMIGEKLWHPCWEERMVGSTVDTTLQQYAVLDVAPAAPPAFR